MRKSKLKVYDDYDDDVDVMRCSLVKHASILIFFGKNIIQIFELQVVVSFSTSSNLPFCVIPGETKM